MKTFLAVSIVIAGFAYADSRSTMREVPATYEASLPCCGPKPEDVRVYHVHKQSGEIILIPEVEGPNGFILTDVIGEYTEIDYFQDEELIFTLDGIFSFATGIPLTAGSTFKIFNDFPLTITLVGYVY